MDASNSILKIRRYIGSMPSLPTTVAKVKIGRASCRERG